MKLDWRTAVTTVYALSISGALVFVELSKDDAPEFSAFYLIVLDCSVLAGCESLRWLTVRGPRAVVNVDAVLALPQLERFAIIGGDKPRADHPHLRYVEWSGGRGR